MFANVFEVVKQLRNAYPSNDVVVITYGKTASIMKAMYEEGELPDVLGLTPDPGDMNSLEEAQESAVSLVERSPAVPAHARPQAAVKSLLSTLRPEAIHGYSRTNIVQRPTTRGNIAEWI
jgi:hypothetical protein